MEFKANNPALKSWVEVNPDSDFPIQNLPFGIFKTGNESPRVGVAIGDQVLDLEALASLGFLKDAVSDSSIFSQASLNKLLTADEGKKLSRAIRERLSQLLQHDHSELRDSKDAVAKVLHRQSDVEMLMPVDVRDYTDFYSSIDHATNVGTMFRDPNNALLPNWRHMPVGYHGRASSIVISGTDIHRPKGQQKPGEDAPVFGPSKLMDFELEMAFITGRPTNLGDSISVGNAEDHIFGLVLFNDLSARDIQKWEYVPLGPFLGKNFGSVISPWVVTLDALEPFRVDGYKQEPEVLPYLKYNGRKNYNIDLEVEIRPETGEGKVVSNSNFKFMYWNMCQQLAHQTVNGCNIGIGDMYASGTISGPTPDSYGSMLEISWKGTKPVAMPDGSERKFLQDNDTVIMRGWGKKDGVRIGFGECSAKILPAK